MKLGPTPVQFPVKVTEPLTAILYITGRAGEHGLTRVLARLDCVDLIDDVQYDRVRSCYSQISILQVKKSKICCFASLRYGMLICNNVNWHCCALKVPKREIFDRSDFPDFYTIKSLREGDFGVKI